MQDMIEWMIERRMCEYGDESEWRKRSGLQPLPPQKVAQSAAAAAAPQEKKKNRPQAPIPIGNGSAGFGGASSEVIDLLSDSDDGF